MPIKYARIPSDTQFQKDSSVFGATRAKDRFLTGIDGLLQRLPGIAEGDTRFTAVADLFFQINSWVVALRRKDAQVDERRYDAIMALLEAVEGDLMRSLGTANRGQLANQLTTIFGSTLTTPGANTDRAFNARSFTSAERELARLHISGGVIRRYMLDQSPPGGLTPLSSHFFYNGAVHRPGAGVSLVNYAPFVMSMEREFYMARHYVDQGGVFHSAYFGGAPVAAAGTMLVENGKLMGIRGDSGHYKPTPQQMAHALRALKALGVDLAGVPLYGFQPDAPSSPASGSTGATFAPVAVPPRQPTSVGGAAAGYSNRVNAPVPGHGQPAPVGTPGYNNRVAAPALPPRPGRMAHPAPANLANRAPPPLPPRGNRAPIGYNSPQSVGADAYHRTPVSVPTPGARVGSPGYNVAQPVGPAAVSVDADQFMLYN